MAVSLILDDRQTAAVLLRAWWQHGKMIDVVRACGRERFDDSSLPAFMPRDVGSYWKSRRNPRSVREYVAAAWPRLSNWLWNQTSIANLAKVIDEVTRLRPHEGDIRKHCPTFAEYEVRKSIRDERINQQFFAIRREQIDQMRQNIARRCRR